MKTLIRVALIASFATPLAWSAGTVKVYTPENAQPKTLTNAGHLIDLVGQPRLANSWWPGAVIGERQATVEAEQKHKALLARLTGLAEQEDGDDAAAINSLRQQLLALKVTGRQKVNLDPDEVRVTEKGNPALEGDYTLWLPAQPTTITVMGLISSPGKKPFTPGRDVASYLDEQSLLSGADNSYAWVIYPDGNTQKAPVAYWNKRHIEPMPGSIIFVGFADHFWTKAYDGLNADILHSLIQRIPE
ncbi:capsule biosynthesis GfcC family protein [Enterobacter cloacae]|uniref:capsule biosynthesis GfcC family protein n=1 Tax=Enterobacter cloacae TaxID=550 RepID=UPI0009B2B73D|nr:capsule biosynthesis GfcC D2 domain-containing protein [Enterobacter cloacae]ELE9015283.1 capsule biosynthesis GfcC family protein [Enterobacter cloacae]MDR9934372.1 capsule biosynthesis GfcC family protein [Enterobacter cloacae subsp. dissolvens]HCR2006333.1 capsule biosynthesis GfcC family protein [Enterobacter cloacae subsp. dissolvens]HCR2165017.1 capsule biosynthesis GfcC family protein [Enterobacter cloacae subsp. dissolvens]